MWKVDFLQPISDHFFIGGFVPFSPFPIFFHLLYNFCDFFMIFLFGVLFVQDLESTMVESNAAEAVFAVVYCVTVREIV